MRSGTDKNPIPQGRSWSVHPPGACGSQSHFGTLGLVGLCLLGRPLAKRASITLGHIYFLKKKKKVGKRREEETYLETGSNNVFGINNGCHAVKLSKGN